MRTRTTKSKRAALRSVMVTLAAGTACAAFQVPARLAAQTSPELSITAEELRGHVFFLASDWLEGRSAETDGYRRASEYAATQFEAAGLDRFEGAYLQGFSVPARRGEDAPTSWNVVATKQGSDLALRDQWVVVTAHLDHLGIIDGEVYNGANDNATGSAAVLEMAGAIAQATPRRSVALVLFGAEEIGLVGSKHFVENSPMPMANVVANLNIDGVGYYVDQPADQLQLLGIVGERCEALRDLLVSRAERSGSIQFYTENRDNMLRRSDQWRFVEQGVPAIMFTDFGGGTYHLPIDDAAPIEYDKLEILTRFLFRLTMDLADRPDPVCG